MKGVIGAVAVLAIAGSAWAGDYHSGATLNCSECHVMHFSQSHGYNGSGIFTPLGGDGPHEHLLRNEINDLCLSCHNAQTFAPDVFGAGTQSGLVRQAGGLNDAALGAPYDETHGHTLGSTDDPPGNDGSWSPDAEHGLMCVDCHQPHGYGAQVENPYRNLLYSRGGQPYPGLTPDYAVGTNDLTKDVYEVVNSGSDHYSFDNIFFNEPEQTESAYAGWCKGCHTDFHGIKGGNEVGGADGTEWLRHPQADADIGDVGGGHSSATVFAADAIWPQVMSPDELWHPTDPADVVNQTPSCFSCHKAHGNKNAFGLIFLGETAPITEEGTSDGTYKMMCKQCHVQG